MLMLETEDGSLVNLEHCSTIGINDKMKPGMFVVIGVFPYYGGGSNWVPLWEFRLIEMAKAYLKEIGSNLPQMKLESMPTITKPIGAG
jgi:hypothetical protein